MPSKPVKTQAEIRFQVAFGKVVQYRLCQKAPVCIDLFNINFPLAQPVRDVPKIFPDERFAAGKVNFEYSTLRHLVDDTVCFLQSYFPECRSRRVQVAMPALAVAFPCYRPYHVVEVSVVIIFVIFSFTKSLVKYSILYP